MQEPTRSHLGPTMASTPLHMFWLLDVSGSMAADGKIEALNRAMEDALSAVRSAAADNPGVQVHVRVIAFARAAEWHVADPVSIEEFSWTDVAVVDRGTTEAGLAIDLATTAIRDLSRSRRGVPPALILVSDGRPTDLVAPSFGAAMRALEAEAWGRKASRMAIGIGNDADLEVLARFIGHDEIAPLRADDADELRHYLRWAATVAIDPAVGRGGDAIGESPPPTVDERPVGEPARAAAAPPSSAHPGPRADVSEAPTRMPPHASDAPSDGPVDLPPPDAVPVDLPPPGAESRDVPPPDTAPQDPDTAPRTPGRDDSDAPPDDEDVW